MVMNTITAMALLLVLLLVILLVIVGIKYCSH